MRGIRVETRGIRVGMMGIRGIRVGMMGMWGIRVGMRGIRVVMREKGRNPEGIILIQM